MLMSPAREEYGARLRHWARALATADVEAIRAELAAGDAADVRRFLANNAGERRELLREELAFVALAFADFDAVLDAYLREVPPRAYDPACSDRERFLHWLGRGRPLTTWQRNFIIYQHTEYAVLARARTRRAEHLNFQRLRASGIAFRGAERLHLNPIRAEARLALPGQEAEDAMFFAAGERVAVLWLEPPARALVNRLAAGDEAGREVPEALVHDLLARGLLACTRANTGDASGPRASGGF